MVHLEYKKKPLVSIAVLLVLVAIVCIAVINGVVVNTAERYIVEDDRFGDDVADCIIVLGARVYADRGLSPMLKDRVDEGIRLFNEGYAPKLLMSGDNSMVNYNEVYAMKQYAVSQGVSADAIFMDHAGFSTYDTMYRAKAVFAVETAIVVTQRYHLYRAVYVGKALGMDIKGVSAAQTDYPGQGSRDAREIAARVKDFGMVMFQPEPKYLGDVIPITGQPPVWE
jgi:vancomycin permeability regulator SanA